MLSNSSWVRVRFLKECLIVITNKEIIVSLSQWEVQTNNPYTNLDCTCCFPSILSLLLNCFVFVFIMATEEATLARRLIGLWRRWCWTWHTSRCCNKWRIWSIIVLSGKIFNWQADKSTHNMKEPMSLIWSFN